MKTCLSFEGAFPKAKYELWVMSAPHMMMSNPFILAPFYDLDMILKILDNLQCAKSEMRAQVLLWTS